jgi:hypothetical protein
MENHDVVGRTTEKLCFHSRQGQIFFSTSFILAMGQIQPPIPWKAGTFPWGKVAVC